MLGRTWSSSPSPRCYAIYSTRVYRLWMSSISMSIFNSVESTRSAFCYLEREMLTRKISAKSSCTLHTIFLASDTPSAPT